MTERYSDYDAFASMYNEHWGSFATRLVPVLEHLVLNALPSQARILDLCCGTGQLAHALCAQGFKVTGIDGSESMTAIARTNAPDATFKTDDARCFATDGGFHAALSTFDSLNHVMSLEELRSVFDNVYRALIGGGVFAFDLNTEEGFRTRWRGSHGYVEDDHACVARSSHLPDERTGKLEITVFFRREGGWERSDLTLLQRCYGEEEIVKALQSAGFAGVRIYDGGTDLGEELPRYPGRQFFVCEKPTTR
ncbi:MAG: class I SAM-dependent methyltransferase [Gemmatimonadota bacterium]|nr:class I SAM-dependent methyltransferase [Gemmatimonadota bacterium]